MRNTPYKILERIETYYKKKIVSAHALLPFRAIREDHAHCTHLQITHADPQPKFCKRVQFSPPLKDVTKYILIVFLLTFSLNVFSTDYYITTSDLNLRSGAGKNYKSLGTISKGDTVKLIDNTGNYWMKIQYHDKIGYSSKQFLKEIQIHEVEQKEEILEETESSSFPILIEFILLFVVIPIILTKSGKEHRNISFSKFTSFFFGALGFQKFYLGQTNKGIFSILFCWTFIPSIIGLIDFIKLTLMSKDNFNIKYNDKFSLIKRSIIKTQNTQVKQYPQQISVPSKSIPQNKQEHKITDQSILDVNTANLDLTIEQLTPKSENAPEPPYWGHTYVYSYDEINHATRAQKKYYSYLKNRVLNDEFVDIQGYTNYAFILYFDFLNEYRNHRDIKLLEEQFKLLAQICPKTKSYSLLSLQDELRQRGDSYSIDKLKDLEEPSYQFEYGYSDYNPDLFKLGNQYKDKLGLDKQEIRWLNKFYNPSNVFTSIEGCCIAIIKQYIFILKELNKQLKKKETTLAKEVTYFKEKLKSIYTDQYDSEWGYDDTSYFSNRAESEIYLTVFKRIENSVRATFGHKRKVSGDFPYADKNLSEEFEIRLGNFLNELIVALNDDIKTPDIETQIELNAQNLNRWKIDFVTLKSSFKKEDKTKFIDGIINLEETNKKNQNIENIFFEASKFIAKYDSVQSLKYYAKYIYYDLKSKKIDNKELSKTIKKSLFKTNEQINDFKQIVEELIETSDIQKALVAIDKIYIPKRKKIKLDKSVIKEVELKHDGTVELLSGYLETGNEEKIKSNIENEEIEISIIPTNTYNSTLISKISIGKIQEELIKKIVFNSFEISQDIVDEFATKNGMFKNQLIDSINEACEEHLNGEALIEEDDENYVIEESYYKEIAI